MSAFVEKRALILMRRAMLKNAMLSTVWYIRAASFLPSATSDVADMKL
jgi:hypothetical protein